MPFSIKRFTIHRSSSLPTHTPRDKKGDVEAQHESSTRILKKSASQEERKPKHSSRQRGLPSSQSVDTADLRRLGGYPLSGATDERLPPAPTLHDHVDYASQQKFQPSPYIGTPDMERHVPAPNPRWRSSAKERRIPPVPTSAEHKFLYDQGSGSERKMSTKRNGVRFQDSDLGTEESQSTSSSSGGGSAAKGEYWEEQKYPPKEGRWGNGRRGSRMAPSGGSGREWGPEDGVNGVSRVKRSQQRRHQHSTEPAVVQDSRPRIEGEVSHRNPLYTPPQSVYDEDPGIMSEVETSATGFRRGNKVRQGLPVIRTPSRTQERPLGPVSPQLRQENLTLGLVFLQYRSETKRALLPNEITTLDTVKALFVRSFPKQLTMEYLDSPHIRIYIHDAAKDMFYELEDLRDIRDRSVLRIYEQDINGEGIYSTWEQDLSYFSEPEFDSEYQNQHIHRTKKNALAQAGFYGVSAYSSAGRAQTLPPGASLRAFSPVPHEPPRPKPPLPPVAYAQTLPWGTHIVTYAPGPPSPEKRPKEIIIPTGLMQPPPKPQRSFQQQQQPPPIPTMVKGIRSTPPPTGPPPSIPSPRSSMARPLGERRHEPQSAYRAPPERPYSAGPYPERGLYEPSAYHSPPTRPGYESGGGYLSSPERRYEPQRAFATAYPLSTTSAPAAYEEPPYYGERIYGTRSGNVTPVVDEEARMRVEYMERQLASLTGLVQKALSAPPRPSPSQQQQQQQQQQVPTRDIAFTRERAASEDIYDAKSSKSSSSASLADEMHEPRIESSRHAFREEKSVSFSDEATSSCSQKQHSPQHPAERPVKPAIKSSPSLRSHSSDIDSVPTQLHPPTVKVTTAERAERESRSKPAPPPKPASLSSSSSCEGRPQHTTSPPIRTRLRLSSELYSHLRHLKKQTKDLKIEVRNLRRIAQAQALTAKETVRETCLKIKTMLAAAQVGEEHVCAERLKVSREEDLYRQDVNHLEKDLLDLESQVEELRGNVINRKCRVNLGDVEGMALILSRASKAVADLKARFPALQESLKTIMAVEMEVVVREEKFLKDEPERLENALRRCKKLTGTLVTLKRLASVQEQRHTVGHHLPEKSHSAEGPYSDGEVHSAKSTSLDGHTVIHVPPDGHQRRGETALDALLCELQTFNLPAEQKRDMIPGLLGPQRRLPSYPSADSPVRSPIHGYGPPGSKSPTPEAKSGNTLQVGTGGKSLSPTPQLLPERKLSPTALDVASRHSPSMKQMTNGTDTIPGSLAVKKVPPPPPPRTTSRSPITSPTTSVTAAGKQVKEAPVRGPNLSHVRSSSVPPVKGSSHPTLRHTASSRPSSREEPIKEADIIIRTSAITDDTIPRDQLSSNSSSSESVNSQEGVQMALQAAKLEQTRKAAQQQLRGDLSQNDDVFKKNTSSSQPKNRQELLEQRHQELLRKQKQLQDQYTRLQQMQRGQVFSKYPPGKGDLKKTGSESNILSKAALSLTPASGSMQHLAITSSISNPITVSTNSTPNTPSLSPANKLATSTHGAANKIFETDIL